MIQYLYIKKQLFLLDQTDKSCSLNLYFTFIFFLSLPDTNADVPSKPKPTFFTNLFKKTGNQPPASSHNTEVKEKAGRKKRKLEEDAEYKAEKEPKKRKRAEDGAKTDPPLEKKKSLNLSCTSLILFDEVT